MTSFSTAVRPQGVEGCVLFPLQPIVGESLPGYVVRACAWNYLSSPLLILREAGLEGFSDLHRYIEPRLSALSKCLGVDSQALRPLTFPRPVHNSPLKLVNGVPVAERAIVHQRRRVAPSALSISDHHRAIWMVRPLGYCAETWDVLIGQCPDEECGQVLGWNAHAGVDRCEHCNFDLKTAPAEKVPIDEREPLAFLAALIDPDPRRRDAAMKEVPSRWSEFDPWAVVELAMMFGRAATDPIGNVAPADEPSLRSITSLATGARILLDYPSSMDTIWKGDRDANAILPAFFSRLRKLVAGEFRQSTLRLAKTIVAFHAGEKRGVERLKQIRQASQFLSVAEAARRARIDNASILKLVKAGALTPHSKRGEERTHAWFAPADIDALVAELSGRTSAHEFCKGHAFPVYAAEQVVAYGLVRPNRSPAVRALHEGLQLDRVDVLALTENLGRVIVRHARAQPGRVALDHAFTALGEQEKPWAPILKSALDGTLPGGLGSDDPAGVGLRSLTLSDEAFHLLISPDGEEFRVDPKIYGDMPRADLKRIDAQNYLNVLPNDVSWLIENRELVVVEGVGIRIRRAEVVRLASKYISAQEIGARYGIKPNSVRYLLEKLEIERQEGCPFWLRAQVEEVLEWT